MLYKLSSFILVPMRSTYGSDDRGRERATWWQWRGRVFRHRIAPLSAA